MNALRRLGAGTEDQLRRLERRIGAERRDRSAWVWLVPLGTMAGTIAMIVYYGQMGGLQLAASIPLGIFSGVFMFGTSAAYLAAGSEEHEARVDDWRRPGDQPSPAPVEPWFIREAAPWPGLLEEETVEQPRQPVAAGAGRQR
jgi:hypothetical protein